MFNLKICNIKIQKLPTCHSSYISVKNFRVNYCPQQNKTKTSSSNKTQKNITESPLFFLILVNCFILCPVAQAPNLRITLGFSFTLIPSSSTSKYFPNSSDALHPHYHNPNSSTIISSLDYCNSIDLHASVLSFSLPLFLNPLSPAAPR